MLYDRPPRALGAPDGAPSGVEHRISFADGSRRLPSAALKGAPPPSLVPSSAAPAAAKSAALAADATGLLLPACAFGPASPPMAIYSQPYSASYALTREVEMYDPTVYPTPPVGALSQAWCNAGVGGGGPLEAAPPVTLQVPAGAGGPFLRGTYQPSPTPILSPATLSSPASPGIVSSRAHSRQQEERPPQPSSLPHHLFSSSFQDEGGAPLGGSPQGFERGEGSPSRLSKQSSFSTSVPSPPTAAASLTLLSRPPSTGSRLLHALPSRGPTDPAATPGAPLLSPVGASSGESLGALGGEQSEETVGGDSTKARGVVPGVSSPNSKRGLLSPRNSGLDSAPSTEALELFMDTFHKTGQQQQQQQQQQQEQQQQQQHQRMCPLPSFARSEELMAHSRRFGGGRPAALELKTEETPKTTWPLEGPEPRDAEGWRNLVGELAQAHKVLEERLKAQTKELSELQQKLDREMARAAADRRLHQQAEAELRSAREELQRQKHAAKSVVTAGPQKPMQQLSPQLLKAPKDGDLAEALQEALQNYQDVQRQNEALRREVEDMHAGNGDKVQAQLRHEIQKLKQQLSGRDALIGRWEALASTLEGLLAAEGLSPSTIVERVHHELEKVRTGGIGSYVPRSAEEALRLQHSEGSSSNRTGSSSSSNGNGSLTSPHANGSRRRGRSSSNTTQGESHSKEFEAASSPTAATGPLKAAACSHKPSPPKSPRLGLAAAGNPGPTDPSDVPKSVRERVREYDLNRPATPAKRGDSR
ncbi:hypothetical protein Esti_006139 [Eimeria stiedai]